MIPALVRFIHPTFVVVVLMSCFAWEASTVHGQTPCPGDLNGNGEVTIDEIVRAVNSALNGCNQATITDWTVDSSTSVPGLIGSLVVDPAGTFAYISTGSALIVVDLNARRATRIFPVCGSGMSCSVDGVDPSGTLVLLHNFDEAVVIRAADGSQVRTAGAGAAGHAAFANGWVYVPAFNGRALVAQEIQGTQTKTINPYAGSSGVAGPDFAVASPDGKKVVFDDSFSASIFVVETSTNQITATIALGFAATGAFFRDDSTVVVSSPGILEVVDLANPTAIPQVIPVDFLGTPQGSLSSAAGFNGGLLADGSVTKLVGLHGVSIDGSTSYPTDLEYSLGVIDIQSGIVSEKATVNQILQMPSGALPYYPVLALLPDGNTALLGLGPTLYFLHLATSF